MAGNVRCDVNDFYSTLMEMLQETVDYNTEALEQNVYEAAESARQEVSSFQWKNPPRNKYNKGWKVYKHKTRDGHVKAVVANATEPSLTHLLERGHVKYLWGVGPISPRVPGYPHIAPAYEHAAAKLMGGMG